MSLLRSAIGTVLRRLRQAQGRTLQDVARAAGVSMPYLSEIERGRKEASSEILAGICRALGIDLPELLDQVRTELLRKSTTSPTMRHRGPRVALTRSATCPRHAPTGWSSSRSQPLLRQH
jgi:transcriptional regulator with XRE-family HTH domain